MCNIKNGGNFTPNGLVKIGKLLLKAFLLIQNHKQFAVYRKLGQDKLNSVTPVYSLSCTF